MPTADAIRWFKTNFHSQVEAAVERTPFTLDMLCAIACQETGSIWNVLRRKDLTVAQVLALCTGDTLDADRGRKAFPKTKGELLGKPNGQAMFDIARKALVDMAQHIPGYQGAVSNPDKFCHGYGIFQYDLQFFKVEPQYFLERRYAQFDASLGKAIQELEAALKRIGWQAKTNLTDEEMAAVAIAYNAGRYNPVKGLKQGYFDGSRYYGEAIFDFIRMSKAVPVDGAASAPTPAPGSAPLPAPTPVTASGPAFVVDVREGMLNVRREPSIPPGDKKANVIASLPDGQAVRAVTGTDENGFLQIETSLHGALIRGYVSGQFLDPAPAATVNVVAPSPAPPTSGITAVYMPRKTGTVTTRAAPAGPHSLNEDGQPTRKGETADARRAEIAAIVEWLAVDNPAHKRYQPHGTVTFCNIYAHDYCHLSGCYVPRVWWTQAAIEALAQGKAVEPRYGQTIEEMRANALFGWLRDFGLRFGWRQTGTLGKLQLEVNQGAIGIIVARRKNDGQSGHIVAVVPETEEHRARRSDDGEVVAPLQSQAGVKNFQYGTGNPKANWWEGNQFAEFAFWLHA